jgi:copper chaperone CopZ
MKLLVLLSVFSFFTMAETFEYKVEGMTCSSCQKTVKSAVCKVPGIKTCDVQVGTMKLTSEEGKTLDQAAISTALDDVNKKKKTQYKIASATKVEMAPTTTAPEAEKTKK